MNIAGFIDSPIIQKRDDGNYYWSDQWAKIMQQLIQQLQVNLSDEGYKLPPQTTANVLELDTMQSLGAILYNTDTDKMMVNIAGTFKEVLTT
jgi:hypothetical protein